MAARNRGFDEKCPKSRATPHVHVSVVEASNALSEEEVVSQTSGASLSSSSSSSSLGGPKNKKPSGKKRDGGRHLVWWCGCGGSDAVLMTCVFPYAISMHATNSFDRTPGSQTPGVSATPEPSTTNNCQS